MGGTDLPERTSSAVFTIPNLLSFLRILLIPVFVVLIVHEPTTTAGILLFGAVVATDWVDGWVARRTGSDLGAGQGPRSRRPIGSRSPPA